MILDADAESRRQSPLGILSSERSGTRREDRCQERDESNEAQKSVSTHIPPIPTRIKLRQICPPNQLRTQLRVHPVREQREPVEPRTRVAFLHPLPARGYKTLGYPSQTAWVAYDWLTVERRDEVVGSVVGVVDVENPVVEGVFVRGEGGAEPSVLDELQPARRPAFSGARNGEVGRVQRSEVCRTGEREI